MTESPDLLKRAESSEILAFLKEEEVRSRNEELLDRAETNLRSYKGDYYGDEIDGRSKAVARDVAEVIDHMEVSVLRVFVSGDRVVEFEPLSSEDEQAADDATEVMRRDFSRKGYRLLHDWFKEGNVSVLGIAKACTQTTKQKIEQDVPEVLLELVEGDIVSKKKIGDDPQMGAMIRVTTNEEKIEFLDHLVPLEEFRFSPDACTLEDAPYLAHATIKTVSDLIEMGFDAEDVMDAHYDYAQSETSLGQRRSTLNYFDYGMNREGALRQVLLMEEYVRYDLDEDGIAERLCVHRVGDTLLRVEEVDYQPFRVYCPFPMPARIDGEALAEKVTDIQRINTALLRLGLDGLYCGLAPGYLVHDDSVTPNTYDDLLTVRPNRIIRWKGMQPPVMEQKQDVSGTAFQAIEFMIGQRESRTGITRLNQGLDAETLNKTATGTALLQAQGQQMEEYLARNFAEALSELMTLKYQLYRRYSPPIRLRVDGQYRMIDPSTWPDEMDVIIRVGLGTGRKEQRLQNRMMVLQIQREVMMAGLPIVGQEQLYKSISGVVRDASLGSPEDFVIDPSTIPPQPPQPSPEEQKMQAEMQLQAAKLQGQQQEAAVKLQISMRDAEQKAELEQMKAAASLELQSRKLDADLEIARAKAQTEIELAQLKARGIQLEQDGAVSAAQLAEDKAILDANLAHGKATLDADLAIRKTETEEAMAVRLAEMKLQGQAADMNGAAAKLELEQAVAAQQADLERAAVTEKAQLARDEAEHDAQLAEDKAAFEAKLALEKMQAEQEIELKRLEMEAEIAARDAARADHATMRNEDRKDAISQNRPGGDLSE